MNSTSRTLAWTFAAVTGLFAGAWLVMGLAARPDHDFHLQEFGRLPVLDHGRVKPIDTLARVSLMILSGLDEYKDADGETQPATRWLLDVMTASHRQEQTKERPIPGESRKVRAYRVEDPEARKVLGLESGQGVVFSFEDLYRAAGQEKLEELERKADSADAGSGLAELAEQLRWHMRFSAYETPHRVFRIVNDEVLALLGLERRKGYRYGFGELLPRMAVLQREAERAHNVKQKDRQVYDHKVVELFKHVELYVGLAEGRAETLKLVAPAFPGDDWKVLPKARVALRMLEDRNPNQLAAHVSTIAFEAMLYTYARGEPKEFNKVVERYHKLVGEVLPAEAGTASTEASFNAFAPFYRCSVLYVIVFVVACVSWLWPDLLVNRLAFWLMVLTLVVHTWALIQRMWIQGRPPVTNLYSSAVFIGWACVLLCVFVEWRFRNALATAAAGLTGFATLLIAHYLGGSGDTLEMMQAVLDTNFWLATHVTTVTIGYSATWLAGLFGLLFLWMMLTTAIMNSLRRGGPISFGQTVVFFLAALGVCLLAMALFNGIFGGLLYLAVRDDATGLLLRLVTGLCLLAGVGFAVYLVVERLRMVRMRQAPLRLPPGTRFLERFTLTDDVRKVLTWMIYGTVCFAMLFSFVGTVLGGIWADQSWGRFWGWDPKENGALLIVIMNALILHARWGGMVKDRGMATLTLVGSMVTMWSWFGTNQLGIGLHAYGFNNALVLMCRWFWLTQLALIGLALLPLESWRSYTPLAAEEAGPVRDAPRVRGKRGSAGIQPA
jgi:ABC-type transport system involved in cytochrome c biogenesis permease subunit